MPSFWPKVTNDCKCKDGIVYYNTFGWRCYNFYLQQISPKEFREILNKMSLAAELFTSNGHNESQL